MKRQSVINLHKMWSKWQELLKDSETGKNWYKIIKNGKKKNKNKTGKKLRKFDWYLWKWI